MTCAEHLKAWLDAIEGDERFVLTVGAGVVNAVFLACGILSEAGYLTVLGGTIVAYITGKTYELTRPEKKDASNVA